MASHSNVIDAPSEMDKYFVDKLHDIIHDAWEQVEVREGKFYAEDDEERLLKLAGDMVCLLENCK